MNLKTVTPKKKASRKIQQSLYDQVSKRLSSRKSQQSLFDQVPRSGRKIQQSLFDQVPKRGRKIQQSLFDQVPKRGRKSQKPHDHFGGVHLKNYNPKSKRPMDTKKALHIVLRSEKAVGERSFKNAKYEARVWDIVRTHANNTGVRIYSYANSGNHLHILLRAKSRESYKAFIRIITGLIARLVGRSERGQPLRAKFWDGRPFSRVVSFATKEFKAVKTYLLRNTLEAIGWLPYTDRNKRLPQVYRRLLISAANSG